MKKFLLFVAFLSAWNVSMAATGPVGREVSKKHAINSRLSATNPFIMGAATKNSIKTSILTNNVGPKMQSTNVTTNSDGTINVPFLYSPTNDDFKSFTVIDNNNDGKTWTYEKKKKALMYRYSVKEQANDYVILPPIKITDTNYMYTFSIDAAPSNDTYGESFEMCYGKNGDAASLQSIYSSGMIYGTTYSHYTAYFSASEPGTYYVAVKATSPKNGWRLYVQNLAVEQTQMKPTVPNMPTDITIEPAKLGETAAVVSFRMPTLTAANKELASDKEITLKLESSVETLNIKGLPGSLQNIKIKTLQGNNIVKFVAANSEGEGIATQRSIYTGMDIPTAPIIKSSVSDDNMTMHMSWETSVVGVNGGYVDPSKVDYMVKTYKEINGEGTWDEYKAIGNQTYFDYTLPKDAEQQVLNLGVTVSNDMGENKLVSSASEVVGTPYSLPVMEYFNGKKMNYKPTVIEETEEFSNATWGFMDPTDVIEDAKNKSGVAMIGYITDYGKSTGKISLPKFSTEGINDVKVDFDVYFHSLMPETQIYACTLGTEEMLVGTIDASMASGWHKVSFDLPKAFSNKKWVTLYVTANYPGKNEEEYLVIDQYVVREVLDNDLAVTQLNFENKADIGDDVTISATVENYGTKTATLNDAKLTISINDKEILCKDIVNAASAIQIQPGENKDFNIPVTINADMFGDAKVSVVINQNDDKLNNNIKDAVLKVSKGTIPVVTDLTAERSPDGNNVDLKWTAINKLDGYEDCENLTAFSFNKILGRFLNIDVDKEYTFIMNGANIPEQGYPKAFQVFNYEQSGLESQTYIPHSGNQCLMAICPEDGEAAADDWLISPSIQGGTPMSFYLDILNEKYVPETVEVLVSNTTNDVSAFTSLQKIEKSTVGWEKCSFDLPKDAKYFAIRYISANRFGIMIDDIDYVPETGIPTVKYNIYRNDKLIAEDIEDNFYQDVVNEGVTKYNVAIKVDGVEQIMSNTAYIGNSTGINDLKNATGDNVFVVDNGIIVNNMKDKYVAIYTIDGNNIMSSKIVSDQFFVALNKGLYIVKCSDGVIKVCVK